MIFNFLHTFYALKRHGFVNADLQSMGEDTLRHLASTSGLNLPESSNKEFLVKQLILHAESIKSIGDHALYMSLFSLKVGGRTGNSLHDCFKVYATPHRFFLRPWPMEGYMTMSATDSTATVLMRFGMYHSKT